MVQGDEVGVRSVPLGRCTEARRVTGAAAADAEHLDRHVAVGVEADLDDVLLAAVAVLDRAGELPRRRQPPVRRRDGPARQLVPRVSKLTESAGGGAAADGRREGNTLELAPKRQRAVGHHTGRVNRVAAGSLPRLARGRCRRDPLVVHRVLPLAMEIIHQRVEVARAGAASWGHRALEPTHSRLPWHALRSVQLLLGLSGEEGGRPRDHLEDLCRDVIVAEAARDWELRVEVAEKLERVLDGVLADPHVADHLHEPKLHGHLLDLARGQRQDDLLHHIVERFGAILEIRSRVVAEDGVLCLVADVGDHEPEGLLEPRPPQLPGRHERLTSRRRSRSARRCEHSCRWWHHDRLASLNRMCVEPQEAVRE